MPNSDMSRRDTGNGNDEARRAASEAGAHARKAASAASDSVELTYEELREQVAMLRADLTGLTEAARAAGVQTARSAYKGVQRAGHKAAAAAEDGYDYAEEQIEHAYSGAEDFIRERPATAVGLAAGAGFVLAMLVSRRA